MSKLKSQNLLKYGSTIYSTTVPYGIKYIRGNKKYYNDKLKLYYI